MKESVLKEKSYNFAIRIVKITQFLHNEKKEFVLSKQILKSGTAIGTLVREAEFGQSKADFINKLSIALKEANETDYWLSLLHDAEYLNNSVFESLKDDCSQLLAILVSSIKQQNQKIFSLFTFSLSLK